MSNYTSKARKAPHAQDSFWANPDNWFWTFNGISYTEASIKRFEKIAEEARIAEERWHKPDIKNLSKR